MQKTEADASKQACLFGVRLFLCAHIRGSVDGSRKRQLHMEPQGHPTDRLANGPGTQALLKQSNNNIFEKWRKNKWHFLTAQSAYFKLL